MQRYAFFDNFKYILITLVVVGHFIGFATSDDYTIKVLWRTIYMFHMPAFIFISGLFAKKMYTQEKGLRIDAVAFYFLMFVLFYSALWAEKLLWNPHPTYNLFSVGSIPWYFFVIGVLSASLPIVSKIRGGAKTVIPLSIALGMIAGFCPDLGDLLCSGRVFTFAPFYFAGYFIEPAKMAEWIKEQKARKWPVICAIAAFIVLFVALYVLPKGLTGTISGLASGHNPYDSLESFPSYIDALLRLFDYGVGAIMILALALLTPMRKSIFSDLGSRTIQVYILHPFIFYALDGFKISDQLIAYLPMSAWIMLVVAIVVTFLLALPKFPTEWLNKLRKSIHIDKTDLPARS